MSNKEYHDSVKLYYEERLRSQIKNKFSHCKGCSNKKQFIDEPGKLIYTCGGKANTSGKCGVQMIIDLSKYMYYPDMKETTSSILQSYIDISQYTDLYSAEEIKEQEEFIKINKDILKNCESTFSKQNKLVERHTLIEKTHKDRINLKKELNLLMNKFNKEEDSSKKYSMMNEYLVLNQEITESYYKLHKECSSINNFLVVETGSIKHESDSFKEPVKKTIKKLGVKLDKNLIPELQELIKQPMNNMFMNIIIAYRDPGDGSRKEQLKIFKEQIDLIFKDQTNMRIYIIEQEGSREDYTLLPELIQQSNSEMAKFNLGILKNIGFSLSSKDMKGNKQAYYVLSDVDMLPSINLVKDYLTYPESPIHLGNKGTRYNRDGRDKNFLGGVLSVSKNDFETVNGYPNDFWGWGGEDNSLNRRFKDNKINIQKSDEPVIDLEKLTLEEKLEVLWKDKTKQPKEIKKQKLEEDKSTWKGNGLSNLDDLYTIKRKFKKGNMIHYKVYLTIE